MITYREMTEADIPRGLSLCRSSGWNQLASDWEVFLRLSPRGCRVAVDGEGDVKGTVTTIRYGNHFGWIGMLLVDPAWRRQGIGQQLLREALDVLRDEDTVKLDATPEGRLVYQKLDFADEYPLTRMELENPRRIPPPEVHAQPVTTKSWIGIEALDEEVFGANRSSLLKAVLKRNPALAFAAETEQGVTGYCFCRSGYAFTHIGPVVADSQDTAMNLLSTALQHCSGRVIVDVPHHHGGWLTWLSSVGFRQQRSLYRMYRGSNRHPGISARQFAILGPEFG